MTPEDLARALNLPPGDMTAIDQLVTAVRRKAVAELEAERDAAKRGWDGALAATHDFARQVTEMMRERDEARAEVERQARLIDDLNALLLPGTLHRCMAERDEARAEVERLRAALGALLALAEERIPRAWPTMAKAREVLGLQPYPRDFV